ncbi:MAG TPA: ParB/RepB/Spo0J family partition protein [Phycisphaerae bacterium]|nr:ParB/RepB/Spo0J family partition protein [Phycisphaerae bacterium]
MTLQWIPLEALEAHPENSNRMPAHLTEKLKAHIERTGLYEPLVVRPMATHASSREHPEPRPRVAGTAGAARYQILNGHHRARVLRELGHTRARCDVWEVDDDEARLLLATLNRLEGRDDPSARARLVARLAEGRSAGDLARLLPEPPDAVERLLRLAQPPPAPLAPEAIEPPARPMTFFLAEEQHALVSEALREVGRSGTAAGDGAAAPRPKRADALERLALWYLESRGLR